MKSSSSSSSLIPKRTKQKAPSLSQQSLERNTNSVSRVSNNNLPDKCKKTLKHRPNEDYNKNNPSQTDFKPDKCIPASTSRPSGDDSQNNSPQTDFKYSESIHLLQCQKKLLAYEVEFREQYLSRFVLVSHNTFIFHDSYFASKDRRSFFNEGCSSTLTIVVNQVNVNLQILIYSLR